MTRTANRRRLKRYLVTNKLHLKMWLANIVYTALIFFILILGVLSPFYNDVFQLNDFYTQNYSAKFFIILLDRLSVALIAVLVVGLIYQIIINHKFCGPLVNFSHTFKKITQCDLTRKVYLRRYDFLNNEAGQVNDMIDALSEHITTIKNDHDRLIAALENATAGELSLNEYQNILNSLKEKANICHRHLAVFKLDDMNRRENKC